MVYMANRYHCRLTLVDCHEISTYELRFHQTMLAFLLNSDTICTIGYKTYTQTEMCYAGEISYTELTDGCIKPSSLVVGFFQVDRGRGAAPAGMNKAYPLVSAGRERLIGSYSLVLDEGQGEVEIPIFETNKGQIALQGTYNIAEETVTLVASVRDKEICTAPMVVSGQQGLNRIVTDLANPSTYRAIRLYKPFGVDETGIYPPHKDSVLLKKTPDPGKYYNGELRAAFKIING